MCIDKKIFEFLSAWILKNAVICFYSDAIFMSRLLKLELFCFKGRNIVYSEEL